MAASRLSARARHYRYRPPPHARSLHTAVIACLRQRLAERHRANLPTIDRPHRGTDKPHRPPILALAAAMLHVYRISFSKKSGQSNKNREINKNNRKRRHNKKSSTKNNRRIYLSSPPLYSQPSPSSTTQFTRIIQNTQQSKKTISKSAIPIQHPINLRYISRRSDIGTYSASQY
ncbi:hypothetical protein [Burkholderia sp. BCC1047]|uniref:hypothetical protein n=1 Tax=Burkholderia sp. BCC1047 TaxID=2676299 RepID=UPI00158EE635|nr:hypothetical protein [Burkholderia sp. BCC1047]